jgi:hypothetical protein
MAGGGTFFYALFLGKVMTTLERWKFRSARQMRPTIHTIQSLTPDPSLKLVSERSQYMRSER